MRTLMLLLLITGLTLAARSEVKTISPQITNPHNRHIYVLLANATWKDSEAAAIAMGGHLATIRNQREEAWITKTFGSHDGQQRLLWIGLTDLAWKSHFAWCSGESVAYTCWASGEPNNVGRGEDFVAIYYPNHSQGGKWNDWGDRTKDPIGLPFNGVVEIIPRDAVTASDALPAAAVDISPTITITNEQGSIKLQWPISTNPYVLEATPDMSKPFTLFGYSETTNSVQNTIDVTINARVGDKMFFRLRKP